MNIYKIYLFLVFLIFSFTSLNMAYSDEAFENCVNQKVEEAGESLDYVYKAVIIQTCKKEIEENNKETTK